MFSDKVFQAAFIISLITHSIILFQNSNLNLNIFSLNKKETNIEVSYIRDLLEIKESPNGLIPKKEPLLRLLPKIRIAKRSPPPFVESGGGAISKKSEETVPERYNFTKPFLMKPDVAAVKRKITLPPLPMNIDKINNPSYISYYQIIREKIRHVADRKYSGSELGKVDLSFLILRDGSLEKLELTEEKSSPSPYLRGIASKSIKEAAPFPNFPQDLDYNHLSFNVVISFEVE